MSNYVYGYIRTLNCESNLENQLANLSKKLGIGVKLINRDELFGFPEEIVPSENVTNICYFEITDGPNKISAEYLIDFQDYAPEAEIGLPKNGLERLNILLSILRDILDLPQVTEIVISMSESNQIETFQTISLYSFEEKIINDFVNYPPPNKAYIIKKIDMS